jgi:hypothetical protein
MKFPDSKDNFFNTDEIEILSTWRKRMEQNSIGKQIIENMVQDPHVREDIWTKFLKNLIARIEARDNDFDAVKNAITEDMLLMGPPIAKEKMHDYLSKLMKVRSLFRYLNDNIPIFRDMRTYGQVFNWIKNGTLTINENFKNVQIMENQPVCWSIFTNDVDNFLNIGDIDRLCDGLGLSDFNEGDYVVELLYETKNIKNPRIPTIIETGIDPTFCPGIKKDEYGTTELGIPEIIHKPNPFHYILSISCKGRKETDYISFSDNFNNPIQEAIKREIHKSFSTLETMDTKQLMEYIEARLKVINNFPPLSARSNEPSGYVLEKIYEGSREDRFKSRFRDAVARLLIKEKERISISDPGYLASLLIFCEQYVISEAIAPLVDIILKEELKGIQSVYGDLHHRALMALARMPQEPETARLWENAMEDERYLAAAFSALREQGLYKIITYLPRFTRLHLKKPGSIDMEIALLTLYENYQAQLPREEITNLILFSVKNEPQAVQNHLYDVLNKSLHLDNQANLLLSSSNAVQLYSLKSLIFCRLLSYIEFEAEQVIQDIKAWILVALLEENLSRQNKWIELVCQVECGKFKGIKY